MIPVFDGHNDALLTGRSLLARGTEGHLDVPRAREGGFAGGLFAIFTQGESSIAFPPFEDELPPRAPDLPPEPAVSRARALRTTLRALGELLALEAEAPAALRVARTAAEVEAAIATSGAPLAAVIHVEGAEVLDPGLRALGPLHALGLRSLGLTWSRPNRFGHGVPFAFPADPDTGPGLTDAGRALVDACGELRVLLDLSHLNARGFWEVAERSGRPLVASHSGAHALCPSARNLTDAQLDAIGASGGLVGIVFSVGDLRADGAFAPDAPRALIARHAAHVAERIGSQHVALGSDFDGTLLPGELRDASGLQEVLADLREAGFSEPEVRGIAHGNWLRVLRETWGE